MVSSTTVLFVERTITIEGRKYIPVDFHLEVVEMRDGLIDTQLEEIRNLKKQVNNLKQRSNSK